MNKLFAEETLTDYTALLSEPVYAPGGGSAGALAGALSAALANMARSLGGTGELQTGERLRQQLLAMVDGDSAAFAPVTAAWALPKNDPRRPAALESARRKAAKAPLELLELCAQCAVLCRKLADEVNTQLLSDVAAAAALCRGAMFTAAVNVRANTFYMKDRSAAEALNRRTDTLLREYAAVADETFTLIYERLGRMP